MFPLGINTDCLSLVDDPVAAEVDDDDEDEDEDEDDGEDM